MKLFEIDIIHYKQQDHWVRLLIPVFFVIMLSSGFLAFEKKFIPIHVSIYISMISAFLFLIILASHSFNCISTIFYTGFSSKLLLIRETFLEFKKFLNRLVDGISIMESTQQRDEIESQTRDFKADFSGIPFPKYILKFIFIRLIPNLLLTILCFSILSMNLALYYDNYSTPSSNIYGHSCLKSGCYVKVVSHFFYYHTVIFQSLGDGNHSPEVFITQLMAIFETLIAFLYLILFLGGALNVVMYVSSELKPEPLCNELKKYLESRL